MFGKEVSQDKFQVSFHSLVDLGKKSPSLMLCLGKKFPHDNIWGRNSKFPSLPCLWLGKRSPMIRFGEGFPSFFFFFFLYSVELKTWFCIQVCKSMYDESSPARCPFAVPGWDTLISLSPAGFKEY